MAQQTAVIRLEEKLKTYLSWSSFLEEDFEQAKAMEKEQIEKAYIEGAEMAKEIFKEELKEYIVLPKPMAIFKYNGGFGALLCSSCRVIMKTGKDFTNEEISAIKGYIETPPQYCSKCKTKQSIKNEGFKTTKQDMPKMQDRED